MHKMLGREGIKTGAHTDGMEGGELFAIFHQSKVGAAQ
jgi:hypothetical protein